MTKHKSKGDPDEQVIAPEDDTDALSSEADDTEVPEDLADAPEDDESPDDAEDDTASPERRNREAHYRKRAQAAEAERDTLREQLTLDPPINWLVSGCRNEESAL